MKKLLLLAVCLLYGSLSWVHALSVEESSLKEPCKRRRSTVNPYFKGVHSDYDGLGGLGRLTVPKDTLMRLGTLPLTWITSEYYGLVSAQEYSFKVVKKGSYLIMCRANVVVKDIAGRLTISLITSSKTKNLLKITKNGIYTECGAIKLHLSVGDSIRFAVTSYPREGSVCYQEGTALDVGVYRKIQYFTNSHGLPNDF